MPHALALRDPRLNSGPHVNASFAVGGRSLPADHGYLLYSAVSKTCSQLHGIDWLAIELISGFPAGRGLIGLSGQSSLLRLRIPAEHYRDVLQLAGKRLDIGGHAIRLGLPFVRPLEPSRSVYARVVTIKKFTEAESFIEAVSRKLDQFGIKGHVELPRDEMGRYRRRIITIHGKSVIGFSVAIHDLNDEDSLLLQAGAVKSKSVERGEETWQSIFSRRAMGCGIFNPIVSGEA